MADLSEAVNALNQFRDERDWRQFHNPKDLALAISIEAGELLETFLWKPADEADVEKVKDELADVLSFCMLLADHYQLDVPTLILDKLKKNAEKYPVEKAKGTARKYTDL